MAMGFDLSKMQLRSKSESNAKASPSTNPYTIDLDVAKMTRKLKKLPLSKERPNYVRTLGP